MRKTVLGPYREFELAFSRFIAETPLGTTFEENARLYSVVRKELQKLTKEWIDATPVADPRQLSLTDGAQV